MGKRKAWDLQPTKFVFKDEKSLPATVHDGSVSYVAFEDEEHLLFPADDEVMTFCFLWFTSFN